MNISQSIDKRVLSRIYGLGRGAVVTPNRFLDLGSRAAIDKALSRLAQSGTVRRLARGVYDYPVTHPDLGPLTPAPDKIAAALVSTPATKLQPSGAYAANLLGLSTQVPAKVVFLTTATPRRVKIGAQEIILKRTTPRNMASAQRVSGLVIQAFRHLGKQHLDPGRVKFLRSRLSAADKSHLLKDMPLAPAWMHPLFRQIAAE